MFLICKILHPKPFTPPKRPGHLCRLATHWLRPPWTELFGSQRRPRRERRHGGCPCDQGGEGSNFGMEILPGYVGAKRGFDEISKQGAMNGATPRFRSAHLREGGVDVFTFMVFFWVGSGCCIYNSWNVPLFAPEESGKLLHTLKAGLLVETVVHSSQIEPWKNKHHGACHKKTSHRWFKKWPFVSPQTLGWTCRTTTCELKGHVTFNIPNKSSQM